MQLKPKKVKGVPEGWNGFGEPATANEPEKQPVDHASAVDLKQKLWAAKAELLESQNVVRALIQDLQKTRAGEAEQIVAVVNLAAKNVRLSYS